ncbi:helix-turn-helix domain-containing protein [Pelagibius sp.]|uniref:AlbA family DNA-binding domain-containing protein n=1 Tax=Pelagibius sp. TaxID=1931238 RepID=UPI003BAE5E06
MTFNELKDRGEELLLELIANAHQESFGLEFKQKEDPRTSNLSKNDRRNLGAALSASSNADGGVIIFGVGTKKDEGIDVAVEALPIADIGRFEASITSLIGEYLRPENPSIATLAIPSTNENGAGYLAIQIGKSEMRPHMSMAPDHQKYFRRGVDSTRAMDHSEIRDMMMAPREARLSVSLESEGFRVETQLSHQVIDAARQMAARKISARLS